MHAKIRKRSEKCIFENKKNQNNFVLSPKSCNFAHNMNNNLQEVRWSENVILADADYIDRAQVILIHQKGKQSLENFIPGTFEELDGKAFKDHLGEFAINTYPIEQIAGGEDFFTEVLSLVTAQKEVKRVMVIPNLEDEIIYNKVREALRQVNDEEKRVTLFAMQPLTGGNYRQEILGYSLMAALGISADEIHEK